MAAYSALGGAGGYTDAMLARVRYLSIALFALACSPTGRGPNLVELRDIGPRHVELGDHLRIAGSGFPEGRAAEVTFRGELHRAGEPVVRDVAIPTEARLASPHALDIVVMPELAARLCGASDPRHTTFRGDVEVRFAPRTSTGSAVGGTLDGVVLDITPDSTSPSAMQVLRSEGDRFARFLGASLLPSEEGLVVASVAGQSRAQRGGLEPSDVVLELDGMIVRGPADFVPPPNVKTSVIAVRRGSEQLAVRVEADGFRYHSAQTLGPAVLLLGLFLAPFLALWSPFGRLLAFLERRVGERLRSGRAPLPGEPPETRARRLLGAVSRQLPSSFLPYLGLVAISSLFTLVALGNSIVARELDLFVVPAGLLAGLFVAALASGGAGGRWSLRMGARRAGASALLGAPLFAALVTSAVVTGSVRADDIVRVQGSLPWEWELFRSPALLIAGVAAVGSLVPSLGPAPFLGNRPRTAGARLLTMAEWGYRLSAAGLLAIVLLGGWQLPGQTASVVAQVLGAFTLLAKSWLLLGLVALLRWAIGPLDALSAVRPIALWLLIPGILALAAAAALRGVGRGPAAAAVNDALGPVFFVMALVGAGWLVSRVFQGSRSESPDAGVQPWL